MKFQCIVITIALIGFTFGAHADVKRGACPAGGSRSFNYVPNADGPSEVTMIFDNPSSDLDVLVGTEVEGEVLLVCQGISTLRQFERCVFGAEDEASYTIVVDSFRGGSAFRIYVGTNSNETVNVGAASASLTEIDNRNRIVTKMVELAKKARKLKR